MSSKAQFAIQTMDSATKLSQAISAVAAAAECYTDSGFNAGGAKAITDADLTASNIPITAAELAAFIALVPTISTFWSANHATINRVRSDL